MTSNSHDELEQWLMRESTGRTVLLVGLHRVTLAIALARAGHLVVGLDIDASRVASAEYELAAQPEEIRDRVQFRQGELDASVGVLQGAPERLFDMVVLAACETFSAAAWQELLVTGLGRLVPAGRLLIILPYSVQVHVGFPNWVPVPSQISGWLAGRAQICDIGTRGEWLCLSADKPVPDASTPPIPPTDLMLLQVTESMLLTTQQDAARRFEYALQQRAVAQTQTEHERAQAEAEQKVLRENLAGSAAALHRLATGFSNPAFDTREIARRCDNMATVAELRSEKLALAQLAETLDPQPARKARLMRQLLELGRDQDALALLSDPDEAASLSSGLQRLLPGAAKAPPPNWPNLRLAGWCDSGFREALAPDCDFLGLTANEWLLELSTFTPDLVVATTDAGDMPKGLAAECRSLEVPLAIVESRPGGIHDLQASLCDADAIFVQNPDCVPELRAQLGHERVHFLAPACQPRAENPFAAAEGQTTETFMEDLLPSLSLPMQSSAGIQAIAGNLAPAESTAIALSLPEHLARGQIVVGPYSRGQRLLFGDLTICSDNSAERDRRWRQDIAPRADLIRHIARRKILEQHCWHHRLARMVRIMALACIPAPEARVQILAKAISINEASALQSHFSRQQGQEACMTVILASPALAAAPKLEAVGIDWLTEDAASTMSLCDIVAEDDWIAFFRAGDYYGPNYLRDLVLVSQMTPALAIGKEGHFKVSDSGVIRPDAEAAWRPASTLDPYAALHRGSTAIASSLAEAFGACSPAFDPGEGAAISVDPFNYCHSGATAQGKARPGVAELVDTPEEMDCGITLDALELWSDREITAPKSEIPEHLDGSELAAGFTVPTDGKLRFTVENRHWQVTSTLDPGTHCYVFEEQIRPLAKSDGLTLAFRLEGTGSTQLLWAVLFRDGQGQRVGGGVIQSNENGEIAVPNGAVAIQYGLRVRGPGEARIDRLYLGHRSPKLVDPIPTQAQTLLVANQYPSYDAFYRNGFVHRRVCGYQSQGRGVDVFKFARDQDTSFAEFENVDYVTGSAEQLKSLLDTRQHQRILVHFLTPEIWDCIEPALPKLEQVTVWVHGADVQGWWHRKHDHPASAERNRAMDSSDRRHAFWKELFKMQPANLHFVFVSDYLANQTIEDLELDLAPEQYSVIHNPIDTSLFAYHPKPEVQRRKVLSIRPFASHTYANDLTVQAILTLRSHPNFQELDFHIIGDGPLFDSTVAPLRGIANVRLEKRFVAQTEIARLHREAGIFLCPSRMDTHGVSRDEAMSSGLVPITNTVGAIPEFVDDSCGILVPPEDADGLAAAIMSLQSDPDRFLRLSQAASERVRRQSASARIIKRELHFLAE